MYLSAFTEAAAAEPENAVDERLGAPGRVHHIVNIAPQRGVGRGRLLRQLAVTQDRAQYVVEIVRDTSRQGTHRLHLLRLPQLCLQQLPVRLRLLLGRHVDRRPHQAVRPPFAIPQTPPSCQQPTPVAVADAIFTFETRRAALEVISDRRLET